MKQVHQDSSMLLLQLRKQREDLSDRSQAWTRFEFFWFTLTLFGKLSAKETRSRVCIVTCDFWGLPAAGGTATAYHLLASSLADTGPERWPVTFLAATQRTSLCESIKQNFSGSVNFDCLGPHHFVPKVVENFPYEALGIAIVRWFQDAGKTCQIVHTHEWGGGLQQLASYASVHQTFRLIVEPHGGHFWSTQGLRQRPTDLFTLRIDDLERQTMHMAHDVKSPSTYMLAHLRQRGWHLPKDSTVIPNIVPKAASSSDTRHVRPVRRLAFFGRLEERKGLKLFCEAVEMLSVTRHPALEVLFIGGKSQVDMMPSIKYLETRTDSWPFPTTIYGELPRSKAIAVLKEEGTMIVLASLIENLPFVLAEACIAEIPFVTFNVGGVTEMLDPVLHADVIVNEISSVALYERVNLILCQGSAMTSVLATSIRHGEQTWRALHVQHDKVHKRAVTSRRIISSSPSIAVELVELHSMQRSRPLKQALCLKPESETALLLVPANFYRLGPHELAQISFLAARLGRLGEKHRLGALVFGSKLLHDLISYPSSPTWMIYHGTEPLCVENVPLLVLKSHFCSSFLAEAGDFEFFHTWLLIKHLNGDGLTTTAFPEPTFPLKNYSRSDVGCFSDRVPAFRKLSGDRAANLLRTGEDVLLAQHLAPFSRPIATFRDDFGTFQGHRGWHFIFFNEYGKRSRRH